jgi:5-hydroxyisourate hydrolase
MAGDMKRISTHILDLNRGKPASDLPVRLERRDSSGQWELLQSTRTDHDGRCGQLLPNEELLPGVYRLVFETAAYFEAQKIESLYPVVEVTFQVGDNDSHLHIPLLLSANGYTTYRGS